MAIRKETTPKGPVTIQPPNLKTVEIPIAGTTGLMINRFSKKAMDKMEADQREGQSAKSRKKRDPKDFEGLYQEAMHISEQGWHGVAASAFRNGMITACKTIGYNMQLAKLALFVVADGVDKADGLPLVRLLEATPEITVQPVRNATGTIDLRARPLYRQWYALIRIQYDADLFTLESVANLLARTGLQVGVGEGRHASRMSAGMGYGCFRLVPPEEWTRLTKSPVKPPEKKKAA